MTQIRLEPGNPHDFSAKDLEGLVLQLRSEVPEAEVQVVKRAERGYGVTFTEVMRVWTEVAVPSAATSTTALAFAVVVKWARDRWRKDRDEHGADQARPRVVPLLGPDGTTLRQVRIDAPDGEAEEGGPAAS